MEKELLPIVEDVIGDSTVEKKQCPSCQLLYVLSESQVSWQRAEGCTNEPKRLLGLWHRGGSSCGGFLALACILALILIACFWPTSWRFVVSSCFWREHL